jgi:hypothetical protein
MALVTYGLERGAWMVKPRRDARADKELLAGIEDRRPVQGSENRYEAAAYSYLIVHANEVPPEELAKVSRRDVFYANVWGDPATYRGEPVHIKGHLRRLIRVDAPPRLWNDGIRNLYEAWIYPDDKDGYNPYTVIFTELPKGAPLGDRVGYDIECDAYFFKLVRYESGKKDDKGRPMRYDAPQFIGRTFQIVPRNEKAAEEASWMPSNVLIPTVATVIGGLLLLFFGLNYWFRRGDQTVQYRIDQARRTEFVAPIATEEPRPAEPAPGPEEAVSDGPNGADDPFAPYRERGIK